MKKSTLFLVHMLCFVIQGSLLAADFTPRGMHDLISHGVKYADLPRHLREGLIDIRSSINVEGMLLEIDTYEGVSREEIRERLKSIFLWVLEKKAVFPSRRCS